MTEQSKFAGALAALKQPNGTPEVERIIEPSPAVNTTSPKSVDKEEGSSLGKRSNPDYEPTTVFLKKRPNALLGVF